MCVVTVIDAAAFAQEETFDADVGLGAEFEEFGPQEGLNGGMAAAEVAPKEGESPAAGARRCLGGGVVRSLGTGPSGRARGARRDGVPMPGMIDVGESGPGRSSAGRPCRVGGECCSMSAQMRSKMRTLPS